MDVRCEKCQTEYELDEARLKPGGVTVKCTNCGHMFKIRKRTITNVGFTSPPGSPPGPGGPPPRDSGAALRPRPSSKPLGGAAVRPADSLFDDDARTLADDAPTMVDRQWLIRLENGEQKSCRELATLQQWIIAGVVTRESLISRTGKTWKRLGDIADLGQYFAIADEARVTRERARPPTPLRGPGGPIASVNQIPGTLPGYSAAQAAGGTILPDDDAETRTARAYPGRPGINTPPPLPARIAARTPPVPPPAVPSPPMMPSPPIVPTALAPTEPAAMPSRHPRPTPPPPPPRRMGPTPQPPAIPQGGRATAMWATDGVKPEVPDASGRPQSGPFVGKLAAIPDEPAFAGRVRMAPGDGAAFESGKVRSVDDDDDLLPARRGSRAGMWVLIMALVVMGGAAAVVYAFVIRTGQDEPVARPTPGSGSSAPVAAVTLDAAAPVVTAVAPDAATAPVAAQSGPRTELRADIEPRLRAAAQSLDAKPGQPIDAPSQALRAQLLAQLAQDLLDRAGLGASAEADNLRKEAKQLVLDAATAAQRALKAAGDDAAANIAMAEVLRLQGKPARDIKRYLDTARVKPDDWARELALADAMVLVRDGKLDDAKAAFAAIDQGDGRLETSGDVRARFHLALALAAQGKAADAKPLVETVLSAQPDHAGARALAGKLETMVARTDPLPPETNPDGPKETPKGTPKEGSAAKSPGTVRTNPTVPAPSPDSGGGDSYDRMLARANAVADTNCSKAMELYAKALEQKPNGVEALAGMGYCHIDAKQFASAFSKFRAALAVSARYEPALRGIAEAYQQQGRREQAIEAYKAYLEVYPNSASAKKQLELLGGDTQAPAPGSSAPPAAPPASPPASPPPASPPPASPPPAQPAPPAQPPAPDPSGAGSGSG